jgi:hypothetical protein
MASAGFGFSMPAMYEGTPYNRAVYLELKELVEHQQRVMDHNNSGFERRGMSPPPPDMFFRDKQRYLAAHRDQFERETAALVVSVSARGDECFLSPARCTANSATVSYSEYLKSLARTGTSGVTAFLAQRLMGPVLGAVFSRNPRVVSKAERSIVGRQAQVFLPPVPEETPSTASKSRSRSPSPSSKKRKNGKGGKTKKQYLNKKNK